MVKLDDKVGFIDETWDWAVENIYDMAFPFSEGLAVVVLNNKYGYVDKKGNLIQSSSSANRKSLEKQLESSTTRQDNLNVKLDDVNTKIFDWKNIYVAWKIYALDLFNSLYDKFCHIFSN
jgi:hypothetical protein